MRDVRGVEPAFIGQTPWMDSALLAAAGIETVVLGGSGAGAHSGKSGRTRARCIDLAGCLAEAAVRYC